MNIGNTKCGNVIFVENICKNNFHSLPYSFYIHMYTNTSDTVVMFLIPNAREQIIRQNVYVRKISKETEQWNVYQKGLVRKKTVGAMTLMWVFFHINV